jgi:protein-S-isoprenylcysteine O-methyltransferase Ste14
LRLLELRIPPPVVAALCALLMWFAGRLAPGLDFDFPGRFPLIVVLVVAGILVGGVAFSLFTRARTTVNPLKPHESSALVTRGVYRWTRNPMYLGMLVVLLAWALFVANGLAFVGLPVFLLYIDRFQIGPEERVLRERFGAQFDDYCGRVRRWL